jgi:hypothetical protein
MTMLRKSAAVLGILVVAGVIVLWGGTFAATRVSGDLIGPCHRALDSDDSTSQTGHASMRWIPPRVHCAFSADPSYGKAAGSEDHVAGVGILLTFGFVAVVVLVALALSWVNLPVPDAYSR